MTISFRKFRTSFHTPSKREKVRPVIISHQQKKTKIKNKKEEAPDNLHICPAQTY